ncbi:MAG: DNA primase [Moorea sp. SIO3I7]|uniref:DNA primase n=1 Tax=Moorena sp. SIO3I8 TaxID=2607833 RepID=UPI0013C1CFCD|nr:DNA primase [Moorena sp. SIO3I8]NEN94492.1 DNA primase [Moorena sp. SIO3I7]NEO07402.1 DNA primase [Moorena sp. SIO3I8]
MNIIRLHPNMIEAVRGHSDIVDVISEHVVMRKRGKEYIGLCPFHDEKTPSFTVSPSKQLYYCFGCQTGGDSIKFLMEIGKQSFCDVVLDLAQRYQVPVQTLQPEQQQELERKLSLQEQLYEIMALATAFYQHALKQPQGQGALEYLRSQRGLRQETIIHFQLGYAPASWQSIYHYLVEHKHKPVELVEQAGLIKPKKGGGYYDYFRDRIMIPIHDPYGRVIAFGGRSLGNEQPKYLNSPETPLFDKGKTLFGLDKANTFITKQDQAVVVEGYFDAIALHTAGIRNVVACLGTALTIAQVRQLSRYTESKGIVLNFDSDSAGNTAIQKAIGQLAIAAANDLVQIKVLNLPGNKDADEFLNSDPDGTKYRELLLNAPSWIDWQIEQELSNKDLNQSDQFQQIAFIMTKLLRQISHNKSQLGYYINHFAQILSQGQKQLVPLYIENFKSELTKSFKQTKQTVVNKQQSLLERSEALLLRIYLHCPEHRHTIMNSLADRDLFFSIPHHHFLWQQIIKLLETVALDSEDLIYLVQECSLHFPDKKYQFSYLFYLDEIFKEHIPRVLILIQAAIACMEISVLEKRRNYCLEQLNSSSQEHKKFYWQEFQSTNHRLVELQKLRNLTSLNES